MPWPLRVIPVIDLQSGLAVHARGGDRRTYVPVSGPLSPNGDPLTLARAYYERFGLSDVYLADLDALAGHWPDVVLYRNVQAEGVRLWVDAGLTDGVHASLLVEAGVQRVIAATETLSGPGAVADVLRRVGVDPVVFGLDLKEGRVIVAPGSCWTSEQPEAVLDEALDLGVARVLILDAARVGSGGGVGGLPLVGWLRRHRPEVEVIVGGGVSGPNDLLTLADLGVSAVLVGSALHDGRLRREHCIHR